MARWTLQSDTAGSIDVEADSWTEAVSVAIGGRWSRLEGARLVARVHGSGAVTFARDGGEERFEVIPAHRVRHTRPDRTPDGIELHAAARYVQCGAPDLCVPFGLPEDTAVPTIPLHAPHKPPPGFDREIDQARARFEATRGQTLGQNAWAAMAIWLCFVQGGAVGLCCSGGEGDTWVARQGATAGLAGGAAAARIRTMARRTHTAWMVFDARTHRAAMVCPLPDPTVGEHDCANGTLELWRSGARFHDWQLEVGVLAATLLSDRMQPRREGLRKAS